MDNQERPLQDYFDAARSEAGISESEVRRIVARAGDRHRRRLVVWRWPVAAIGVAAIVIGAVAISDSSVDSTSGVPGALGDTSSPATASHLVLPGQSDKLKAAQSSTNTTGALDTRPASNAITSSIKQPTSIPNEKTMNRKHLLAGIAATAMTLGAHNGASAQEGVAKEKRVKVKIEVNHSPTMERMADELGRSAANFWTGRLNAYKSRIDRILSPSDLEKLNRLRVRFGVMLAEHADVKADVRHGDISIENEEHVVINKRETSDDGELSDGKDKKIHREVIVQVDGGAEGMELFAMHQSAKDLAVDYREQMDKLGADVLADVVVFLREMHAAGEKFVQNNRVEIEKEEDGKKVAVAIDEAKDFIESFNSPEKFQMMQMVYSMFAEPIVMLYDGADLKQLFNQASPLSAAVTGLNLPSTSALKQNVPNPASSSTAISYTLDEPSSSTMLRLYNASGELVGTYDQGARDAGDHAVTIDLSSLPNGVYLYHLTVHAPSGERVHSKAMQVAK